MELFILEYDINWKIFINRLCVLPKLFKKCIIIIIITFFKQSPKSIHLFSITYSINFVGTESSKDLEIINLSPILNSALFSWHTWSGLLQDYKKWNVHDFMIWNIIYLLIHLFIYLELMHLGVCVYIYIYIYLSVSRII